MINLTIGMAFMLAGSVGFVSNVAELRRAFASRRWAVSEAEIVRVSIEVHRPRKGQSHFEPIVSFRYAYDGREYVGRRVAFGSLQTSSRVEAERFVAQFTPGARWPVNICPAHPHEAVLEPGPQRSIWISILFSLGFAMVGTSLVLDVLRPLLPTTVE